MKLYIANVSTQIQVINYRPEYLHDGSRDSRLLIPFKTTPPIPSGSQMAVGGDMSDMAMVESIVAQLTTFGMVAAKDIGRLPTHQRIVYVFNVDKPVAADAIRTAHDHNRGVKIEDGRLRRQRSAIAASDTVARVVGEQAEPLPPLKAFDISVEQEEQSPNGESRVEEGYKVAVGATDGDPPAPRGRGRGGRGSRAA